MRLKTDLIEKLEEFCSTIARPVCCGLCGAKAMIWWDGHRIRSGSFLLEGHMIHLARLRLRRVRCSICDQSWTLRPPGMVPHCHYQLGVMTHAVSRVVAGSTEQQVAEEVGCARRTVGRWLRWFCEQAEPAILARHLLALVGDPILPTISWAYERLESLRDQTRRRLLESVAEIVALIEAIALASGQEPSEILPGFARRQATGA